MVTSLILACISFAIFIIYNAVAIKLFGIPSSLSNTFYLYLNKAKGLGYIFTAMMFAVASILLPAWIEINQMISSWSSYLNVLPFLGAGSICFVGAAPAFRPYDLIENKVHMISAGCAAAFSLVWIFIVSWKLMWIVPLCVLFIGGLAHLTKTQKSGRDYWLEMIAFLSTFSTIITEAILHL